MPRQVPASLTSVSSKRIRGLVPALSGPSAALLDVVVSTAGQVSTIPKAFRYVPTPGSGTGVWASKRNLPTALGEVAGGVIDGVLYLVGEGSAATFAFDMATETWQTMAVRPLVGNHHAAEVIDGKLYLFGGLGAGSEGTVQIFDPLTNSWSIGASAPFATGSASTALIKGLVYMAGGISGALTLNQAAVYNPATNRWVSIASMPAGRNHAASGTDGQSFFVFGGRGTGSGDGNYVAEGFDDVQIYNPATNTWQCSCTPGSNLRPLPQKRGGSGKAPFLHGEFYVIGGETTASGTGQVTGGVYNRVDVYSPTANQWRLDAALPTARHGIFPLAEDNRIIVAGGGIQAGFSQSDVVEILQR